MTRPNMADIDVPPLPDGLEVRPVTRDMLPQVWAAASEAFRDHFGGQDFSPQAYTRWAEDPLMEPELLVVAFDGDEMAAGVQGGIDPRGERSQWLPARVADRSSPDGPGDVAVSPMRSWVAHCRSSRSGA